MWCQLLQQVKQSLKTKREKQVVKLLERGLSQADIADRLGIDRSRVTAIIKTIRKRAGGC